MSSFHNIEGHRQTRHWRLSGGMICLTIVLASLAGRHLLAQNKSTARVDEKGRKFVNKIPYDVFFDNPLQVVNSNKNAAPVPETPAEKPTETKPMPTAPAESTSPAKSGGIAWQELLPMELLKDEVKSIRNRLTSSMANQAQFNKEFKPISFDGAELAALAGIVLEHSESVSWKDKAQFVRDFGAQLNQYSIGLSKENFDKTKGAYQKLTSIFEGSIPADAGDIPASRPFSEVAPRKALMKRIEKAKDWLKQDVNSEAKFKSMSDKILHESAVLSALATVVSTESYGDAEADDYKEFVKTLIDGAKESSAACKDEDYEKFKNAIDKVNKSCTDCHGVYGNK